MKGSSKQAGIATIASDLNLKSLAMAMKTRRAKLFLYGFAFAFAAFTAYLAFFPGAVAAHGDGSLAWYNGLFASTAPYRSQISNFFSSIFPNSSSSPSPSPSPEAAWIGFLGSGAPGKNHREVGGGSPRSGVAADPGGSGNSQNKEVQDGSGVSDGSGGSGNSEKKEVKDGNGVNAGSGGSGNSQNEKVKDGGGVTGGSGGSGNSEKKEVNDGIGVASSNQTASVKDGSAAGKGNGGTTKSDAKNEMESKKDASVAAKNQTGGGSGSHGSGVPSSSPAGTGTGPGTGTGSVANSDAKGGIGSNKDSGSGSQGNVASTSNSNGVGVSATKNATKDVAGLKKDSGISSKNQTTVAASSDGNGVSSVAKNGSQNGNGGASDGSGVAASKQKEAAPSPQMIASKAENGRASNYTSSLVKGNGPAVAKAASNSGGNNKDDWIKAMVGCDMFQGRWVNDDSYPLYPEGSCPHIDEPFNCYLNGRPDRAYQKLRWKPNKCSIPRLNPTDMLERLRGKRLVFVGDSLNRNMWESLVCILRHSVKDKKKVFEASGRHEFKSEGSYSFLFADYNCSVEFFRSPFLVQEWEMPVSNGTKKETLRLDIVERSFPKYKDADIIIFNTGHWWTHEKTARGKDYYQEGNHVYSELNVEDAFRKALNTWAKWIDANVNSKKSTVLFRGYSASHFRGGQWNSGGQCNKETEPIKNERYLSFYLPMTSILEDVIHGMKTPVIYLNITRMSDYRKDAHPSIYRKQNLTEEERRSPERYQDCSHWCLPGVPDSWNELLYAQLMVRQYQMLHQ